MPSPRSILVGGWAAFLVYAWPGYLGWDAMTQLAQARRDHFTDDHPPAMARLWQLLEHFVHGPALMLLLVTTLFVWGLYTIFARVMTARRAAIVTIVVLWFPPIGTIMAAIFKDTMMAACLVAGVALLGLPKRSWLGLAAIGAATLFRYNALAATFPLVLLLWRFRATVGWRRYAIAFVAWLGVTGIALATPRFLADEQTHYWYWSQGLQDIAGTLEYSRDFSDAELAELFDGVALHGRDHVQSRLRAIYSPVDFRHLDRGPGQVFEKPETPEQRAAIARTWRTVVFGNFGAYLHFRWDNFAMLMRFDHAVYVNTYARFLAFGHEDTEFLGHDAAASHVQDKLRSFTIWLSTTPVFDPSVYLVLALLLVPFVLRDRLAGALLASGVCYQAAWLFLAPTADYRYSHWFVTTTIVALVLAFVRRYGARRSSSSGS